MGRHAQVKIHSLFMQGSMDGIALHGHGKVHEIKFVRLWTENKSDEFTAAQKDVHVVASEETSVMVQMSIRPSTNQQINDNSRDWKNSCQGTPPSPPPTAIPVQPSQW